jgi:hypothetical protein
MKKVIVLSSMVLFFVASYAQSEKFMAAMKATKTLMDSAKTTEQYTDVAAKFERIGDAEKTQWLPYYYATMCQLNPGWNAPDNQKEAIASKAETTLAKAEAIENNSEIYVLKSMIATMKMLVDPMNRWASYGAEAKKNREAAMKADPNNPRPYLMEGQSMFGTPEQFGGGKKVAKPLFEKAVALYKTFKPATEVHPTWGVDQAMGMLKACE